MPPLPVDETDVATADGRVVRAASFGPRDGVPVIWHHGNPGSRVADLKDDIEPVADAYRLERFGTMGISGGGAFALGTAALLPDRVFAAAVLSGAAPIDAGGLEFGEGMTETNVRAAEGDQGDDRAATLAEMEPIRQAIQADARAVLMEFAGEFPQADRDVLDAAPEILAAITEGMAECVRVSSEGWLDDSTAFASPWGFDVGSISVPVGIWQGRDDTATPIGHARWLTDRIRGAELVELDGGHYAPYVRFADALAWLVALA
jgi:pimeloyl-ACP methyl ester carboxylesterase